MIRKSLILILSILSFIVSAQVPSGFRFQAVLRNAQNTPIVSSEVELKVELLRGSITGDVIYSETHATTSSASGLINVIIGNGTSATRFEEVDWSTGPFFINLYIDNDLFSTSQLLSVPFAMHSATADSIKSFKVSSTGDTLAINGNNFVVPGISSKNASKYATQICLGGSNNEEVIDYVQLEDGSYIIGGTTESRNGDVINYKGQKDIWIVKVDAEMNKVWQKTVGGSGMENLHSIKVQANNTILFSGTSESSDGDISDANGNFDIIIGELSEDGQLSWVKNIGGGNTDFISYFNTTSDNGYLVGGTTFSLGGDVLTNNGDADIWIAKLNSSRELVWQKSIGGLNYDGLVSLYEMANNELLIFGNSESNNSDVLGNNGGLDFWVGKLNSSQELTDQVCIGSTANEMIRATASNSTNTLISGITFSNDWDALQSAASRNLEIVNFSNTNFSVVLSKTLGGTQAEDVKQILPLDDGYLVLAETESYDGDIDVNNGDADLWLIKLSANLDILAKTTLGGSYKEDAVIIEKAADNGYILAANTTSSDGDLSLNNGEEDIWLVKLDANLEIVKEKTIGGTYSDKISKLLIPESGNKIILIGTTSSNDYGISGLHGSAGKNNDIWILETEL